MTRDEYIIEAALMAYDAGVHVLSMSLGNGSPWSDNRNPLAKVCNSIAAKGVSGEITHNNAFFIFIPILKRVFLYSHCCCRKRGRRWSIYSVCSIYSS